MTMDGQKKTIWLRLGEYHAGHPYLMLTLIILGTIFFVYEITNLRIHTDFFDLYPPKHPYIQLYKQYRHMFGTANVMTVVLEVKNGDIYNVETIKKLDRLTKGILAIERVNPVQVISVTHPKLKSITVGAANIEIAPLVHPRLPETNEDLRRLCDPL